ncbi:hypothetical protein GFL43_10845 [Rhizobium laguerreae]|nr:hypothetical protein [Rhizobium laguerreae]
MLTWIGSAFHGSAEPLQSFVLRNSGRKTASHFSWNCSDVTRARRTRPAPVSVPPGRTRSSACCPRCQ